MASFASYRADASNSGWKQGKHRLKGRSDVSSSFSSSLLEILCQIEDENGNEGDSIVILETFEAFVWNLNCPGQCQNSFGMPP